MQTRMDAAAAVDAQNASPATWKTAQNAVSHSAHTLHRSTHEVPDTPRFIGFHRVRRPSPFSAAYGRGREPLSFSLISLISL